MAHNWQITGGGSDAAEHGAIRLYRRIARSKPAFPSLAFAARHGGCDCEVFSILPSNLIVVVEVLFPSTDAIDHGANLSGYFSLPSMQHYLILDPEHRVLIHHKRAAGDALETRVLSATSVKLYPPGFDVAVAALFPLPSA